MSNITYEGVVVDGKVHLPPDHNLPDNLRVLVTVPGAIETPRKKIDSPRLVHPEQANDFAMEVDEAPNATL